MAAAAAAVVAATFAPTEADARWGGGWRGGHGWRGGGWGWRGPAVGFGLGLGLAAGYPYYGYYGPGYYPYYGCWRRVVIATPYGPRARRVWVCG